MGMDSLAPAPAAILMPTVMEHQPECLALSWAGQKQKARLYRKNIVCVCWGALRMVL
jgi:hypothetical protein